MKIWIKPYVKGDRVALTVTRVSMLHSRLDDRICMTSPVDWVWRNGVRHYRINPTTDSAEGERASDVPMKRVRRFFSRPSPSQSLSWPGNPLPLSDRVIRFGLGRGCLLRLLRFSLRASPILRFKNAGLSLLRASNRSVDFPVTFGDPNIASIRGIG